MDFVQNLHCFYLKNNNSLNQNIRNVFTHKNPVIHHLQTFLLPDLKTSLPQFMNQRIFINLFQKATTQRIRNRISTANDLGRYLF